MNKMKVVPNQYAAPTSAFGLLLLQAASLFIIQASLVLIFPAFPPQQNTRRNIMQFPSDREDTIVRAGFINDGYSKIQTDTRDKRLLRSSNAYNRCCEKLGHGLWKFVQVYIEAFNNLNGFLFADIQYFRHRKCMKSNNL